MHNVIISTSLVVLVTACAAPAESFENVEREGDFEAREDDGFPTPTTLGEFDGNFFEPKLAVTIVERAPEGDGYRALGIDVESGRITYQILGPREEVVEIMTRLSIAGLDISGCGVTQGVFTPPPVPPPTCGGRRCEPVQYLEKAKLIAELSCR
jgi:hypothetical protein